MRSGDLSMPEERNRIEVDRLAQLLLAPDERSRATLEAEGVRGRIEVVGDVMRDALDLFAPIARSRSDILERFDVKPGATSSARSTARRTSAPNASRASSRASTASTSRSSFRSIRARPASISGLGPHVRLVPPLGYLDFAALVSQARAIVTDSGGLQKEAYWYGVPCITLRPSTEWVDTVAAARTCWSTTTRMRSRRRRRTRGCPTTRRSSTATGTRSESHRGGSVPFRAREPTWDVAVIGAGYVGLPLAQTFAEAGQTVVLVDVVESLVDALNRGESHIDDVPSEKLEPLVESGAITATIDYAGVARRGRGADRRADTALPQREPDLSYIESAVAGDRAAPPRGARRRARVDDLPGDDARDRAAARSRRAAA